MKNLLIMVCCLASCLTTVKAQDGGGQRRTAAERTRATMEKLAVLNLDADATTKTTAVIADYNEHIQKAMDEMRASGAMNRDSMMAKRKVFAEARDNQLKGIFTPEQMKKWTEEIAPSLRQRGNGPRPQ